MTQNQLLIHIGLPKVASTSIQRTLELSLKHNEYIYNPKDIVDKLFFLFSDNKFHDKYNLSTNYNNIKNELKTYFSDSSGSKKKIISSERLSFFAYDIESFKKNITLIKELAPSAKIVLVVREPMSFLESYYKQAIASGIYSSPNEFFGFQGSNAPQFKLKKFSYLEIYNDLNEIYPGEFKILFFEDFISNKKIFMEEFLSPISVGLNPVFPNFSSQLTNRGLTSAQVNFICSFYKMLSFFKLNFLTLNYQRRRKIGAHLARHFFSKEKKDKVLVFDKVLYLYSRLTLSNFFKKYNFLLGNNESLLKNEEKIKKLVEKKLLTEYMELKKIFN